MDPGAFTRTRWGLVVKLILSMPGILESVPNIIKKKQKGEARLKCMGTPSSVSHLPLEKSTYQLGTLPASSPPQDGAPYLKTEL